MIPSRKQQAIYDCWENNDENILINAVAGSGKTSTLIELLTMCEYRTLFLAFNKSIQTEIQHTIETRGLSQGKALTMHSLGLQAISAVSKYKINANKNYDLVKIIQDEYKAIFKELRWEDRVKTSYTLMDMNDVSRIYLTDDIEKIKSHMYDMDKPFNNVIVPSTQYDNVPDQIIETVWNDFIAIRTSMYHQRKIEIDFQDMIYVPLLRNFEISVHPYYLMIDEAQDLNIAQHELIDKLLQQGSVRRWIAVGDKNQAIYGFSGAYSSSFDKFAEKDNVIQLPLDICYRCPVDIITSANEVYPVMEGFKKEPGIVKYIYDYTQIKDESMVICRNSSPLLELYFKLLSEGKKVVIKGEDILGNIHKFLKPYNYKTINDTMKVMDKELKKLSFKMNESDSSRYKYYRFKENYEDFVILSHHLSKNFNETIEVLLNKLKSIFDDKETEAITLCTIHKSKGLESDIVYILNEHLIPSKFAKSSKQLKQEENLKYVARTRAKKEMYFLTMI